MQVSADWIQDNVTPEWFADEFKMDFSGPGFYMTDTDTMLVVAFPPRHMPNDYMPWQSDQPAGTTFEVHVFNCPMADTIYGSVGLAAIRVDRRTFKE